jgi:hypothetical protein
MDYNNDTNVVGEIISRKLGNTCSMLDKNNIVWKVVNGEWIGKRSVWTKDYKSCCLEDTTIDNVKSWWCGGVDADYTEIFKRDKPNVI